MAINQVRDPDEVEEELRNAKRPEPEEPLARSVPLAARQTLKALEPVEALLKKSDYEGVRQVLAKGVVTSVGLFISPARAPQKPRGAWSSDDCKKGSDCDASLITIKTNLQLLEEWCFSNRIQFFTEEEKEKLLNDVATGKLKGQKVDLSEPLDFLGEAKEALKELTV